jgi:hypothetical protein
LETKSNIARIVFGNINEPCLQTRLEVYLVRVLAITANTIKPINMTNLKTALMAAAAEVWHDKLSINKLIPTNKTFIGSNRQTNPYY